MSRFAPSASARTACEEVLSVWQADHYPDRKFAEELEILACRVNSWVAPSSVLAGVKDVMWSALPGDPETREKIDLLGNKLAHRLNEDGLLVASPRRAGNLG